MKGQAMSETNETPRGTVIFDLRDRMRLADAELQLRIESGQVDPISVGQVLLHQTVAAAEIAPTEQSQACRQLFWLANMEINLAQAAAAAVSPKEQ
jgi:hypothetical protein